ncbi:hypothetical protein A3962_10130 [Meiothermus taiwanensis]|nr:hypothetical protein A3962_10130 [Meiothermus taiwanensis]
MRHLVAQRQTHTRRPGRRPEGIAALWLSPGVERTFAWLSFNRDYEPLSETSETLIYAAMIRLMVRRLAS